MVDLVIIILNYNSSLDTIKLVKEILNNTDIAPFKMKIVVVDNNSTDDSYNRLKMELREFKEVVVLKNNQNCGYACGNNLGARYAIEKFRPKYLMIVNPDVRLPREFIPNMIKSLEVDQSLGMVTGIMILDGRVEFSSIAWKLPKRFDDVFLNSILLKLIYNPIKYSQLDKQSRYFPNIFYVDVIPGSCFVIRSDLFEKIGYFDEATFLYAEERILARKIKDYGLKVGISISDYYFHDHKNKTRSLKRDIFHSYHLYRSRLYYNIKYNKPWGYIILPFFVLSAILGFIERVILDLAFFVIKRT